MFHAQSDQILDMATGRVFIVSSQPLQEMTDLTPRQTISDRANDIAFSEVSRETDGERSEGFSRTIATAETAYRYYGLILEYNWAKSVWPVVCSKTGTRFEDLGEGFVNPTHLAQASPFGPSTCLMQPAPA